MEKTIKYLEDGEYHYATVRAVGDLAKLKTDSKEDLVSAINNLFDNSTDPDKAPKPEGYDKLVKEVADAIKGQQDLNEKWDKWQKDDVKLTEERKQEYLQNIKSLQDSIDKAKEDASALTDKTNALSDQLTQTFSELDTSIQNMHDQLQKETESISNDLNKTKGDLTKVRTDLQNTQLDNGKIHDSISNINGKFEHKVWEDDLAPMKEQINRNETEVQQTKDQLLEKASQKSVDTLTNAVSNLDTQVKKTAQGLEVTVKKDELGGEIADALNNKTNLLLGTRSFSGDSWGNKTFWHEEAGYWKGLKVFSSTEIWFGLQYKYEVKQGQQYTFSFWARQEKDNSSASIVLSESDKGDQGITTPYTRGVHIGTEWKRYSLTFQAESDGIIYPRVEQNVQGNKLYIAGYKLELGSVATPWEPNEADVAENIEHTESQFDVYSDQIAGIVKKQEKMGDTERQLDTRITETAEGLKQTSKDLQDANGKITEFNGKLESTAHGLKTEYEKYTNDAIGQISDSSLNLIHNSAFSNQDDQFESWQNISAKATVREDSNNLHWVELTQSGQGTDNPIGVTSNYFIVKQGKVTVAVDVKLGDKANLDNQNILLLELYDESKKRVDFTDVSVSQLGLSMSVLNDHNVHRGLYRLGIDRKDVKYMTVKAILHRNGDLWLTNFSARLSSIDDGGYTPNPDDLNQQILKMNTKIEEDAEHIALKANSVDVTRDIKSAVQNSNGGGVNLLKNTQSFDANWIWNSVGHSFLDGVLTLSNISGTESRMFQNLNEIAPKGKTFSVSFDARINENCPDPDVLLRMGPWDAPMQCHVRSKNFSHFKVENWEWQSTKSETFSFYVRNGSIDLKRLKLEYGSVATPWTPAYEDTSAEIKSAKDAAIKVASDQINLHVNELSTQFDDKLNKRVNEVKTASEKFTSDGIEQTVKKITDVKNQVDGIQVGGRNYLRNSDKSITGFAQDLGTLPNEVLNSLAGKTITVSVDVEWNDFKNDSALENRLGFEASVTGSDGHDYSLGVWKSPNTSSGKERISTQYTLPFGVTFTVTNNSHNGYVSINGTCKVSHAKIEVGNKATDWTPAPEDTDNKISDAKTEVTASVKNLGDRVTTEVNSITAKVDNLQIGGRNLLKNTDKDIGITSHTTDEQPAWAKYETGYNLENGKTYTLSAEIKNSASEIKEASIGIFDGATNVGTVYPLLANGQRQSVTFSVPNDTSKYQLYFYAGHAGEIPGVDLTTTFHHVKLEIGNKATDWTPAPEDTTNIISELNAKWDVANGQIRGKVTEKQVHDLLNNEHYATESWTQAQLKLTSDNFNVSVGKMAQKLDNLTIGGRNLIYGTTDFELLYSGTFTDSITIRQVLIDNELAQKASTMTYSATIRPDDAESPVQLAIYKTKGDSAHTRVSNTPIAVSSTVHYGDSKRLSLTFNLDQDMKGIEIVALVAGSNTFKMFGVKEEKLEIGSVPTDWSPAPEEYAKTSNIISTINMSPEQIKLSSNKIVLDGDTEIKGTAFIPSAAIKDITADKITAGTLDVGKLDIKNLKADDIKTGTLSGITIRAGDEDSFFQTSKDNIYWITNSGESAVIGKGKYVRYPGLNVFDKEAIYLGSWAGAVLNQDGTINDRGGAYGNPKLAIETAGMKTRFNGYSFGGDLEPKPLDRHRITSWVGPKEFLLVEQGNGTHIELNPNMASSQFTVQKDNKFGAYFGQGREGNEINFTPLGGMTINGNFRVTGAKNAIVKTSQGTVAINAYETADYYFGDIGSAKTGDNKVAMINIESLFKETVNTDVEYQVFLTSYGPGDIWVSERQRDYFVVESELPNMEFGWEIKAKRKGYENTRLAKVDVSNVPTV